MSAWTTYHGYLSEMGGLAIPIAVAVTTGLFACDMIILDRRSKGNPLLGAIAVLLIFTIASWLANFHFFYSKFVGNTISASRYEEALVAYRNNISVADIFIRREDKLPNINALVNQEFKVLGDEVRDPRTPGFGDKALERLAKLKDVTQQLQLAIQWPTIPPKNAPAKDNESTLAEINRRVQEALKQSEGSNPWRKAYAALGRAQSSKLASANTMSSAERSADDYLSAVKAMVDETRNLERVLKETAEQSGGKAPPIFPVVLPDGAQLVRITDSIRHGVIERHNVSYSVSAALFALLIDFMPFFFALLLISPAKRDAARLSGGSDTTTTGKSSGRPAILNKPPRGERA
jgi:hypothetical protein